jgi:hypothetical protein
MANPTTIECLKYLHTQGTSEAERQEFFNNAPYVLRAQIISAQRNLKQPEVRFPSVDVTEQNNEEIHLQKEIDSIAETCLHEKYKEKVKELILRELESMPEHFETIEEVNEKAGKLFTELTSSDVHESKTLAKKIVFSGNRIQMRNKMDEFLNTLFANKLEYLASKTKYIKEELLKSAAL